MQFERFAAAPHWPAAWAAAMLLGACAMAGDANRDRLVTDEEIQAARRWLSGALLEPGLPASAPVPTDANAGKPPKPAPGLTVLANHDPVWLNARGDRPMKLGDKLHTRGLYCHAVSKVVVQLPAPGRTFTAVVGVDSNRDTAGGRGSVIFSVTIGGKTPFRTPVMRESTPAINAQVDLAGAETFTLEVSDAGDGISCDQSDWADAKVLLADGREIWLGELPLRGQDAAAAPRTTRLPFSFLYAGRPSDQLLPAWPLRKSAAALDNARTRHTLTWTDPATGLEVQCVAVQYSDFPAAEWTVHFRNTSKNPAPILESIQGLDATFELPGASAAAASAAKAAPDIVLHTTKGDTCRADLYEPLALSLEPGQRRAFAPQGGRGTNGAWPYFHLAAPAGGLFVAVGWPGQWAASFARTAPATGESASGTPAAVRALAGQQLTRIRLAPGQSVRSPLIALVFHAGRDAARAQNIWRRWMIAHSLPRTPGEPGTPAGAPTSAAARGLLPPPILHGNTSGQFNEMIHANEDNQIFFIDRYVEERVGIDSWWMDAGWYPCGGHWPNTGTWEPDLKRFPRGLRAISDHARKLGVKTLVWFEPERVAGGTWLAANHADWLLGPLLHLGNADAQRWLTDHVDRTLARQGIDIYRQDFNMDPLGCWRGHDSADRQGLAENLHVQGYLAYWDELRRRHPNLVIDSCASGGRRNDLETMRRAVALHPTDYNYGDLNAKQAFHFSLFNWLPYFGSNTVPVDRVDAYAYRSGHALSVVLGYDLRRKDHDCDLLRKLAADWRRSAPCYYGDYYPLTPYSLAEENWIAWQFHRGDLDRGIVEAFRRPKNNEPRMVFALRGLDAEAEYLVTNTDAPAPAKATGRALMEKGLTVEIPARPGAVLIEYGKTKR